MNAIRLAGDKSISHRALILASLAEGPCRLRNLPASADVDASRAALEAMGVQFMPARDESLIVISPESWHSESVQLSCGNSGTTARLLTGLLTGVGAPAILDGDESLRSRPMDRVVYPLQSMGGRISYLEKRDRLPIRLDARTSGALRVLRYRGRVASAQVKSAVLLAGLASHTEVEVWEPRLSRDHLELMLEALGAPLVSEPTEDESARVRLSSDVSDYVLPAFDLEIPGDISSASFLIAAGLITGRPVRVEGVGLNPTRTGFLDLLRSSGVEIEQEVTTHRLGEPVGTVELAPGAFTGFEIGAEHMPSVLDEIPLLAVLAVRAGGRTRITGAGELRLKESDRLAALAVNLRNLGVQVEETADGLAIEGTDAPLSGPIRAFGDHRIAMAFSVLDCDPRIEIEVDDPGCARVSYPEFAADLERILSGAVP
ncbi:MAG: 3-phosphoshikimate 1-carboxyvinyltransferase [marine benthic group bacterium]|nr:3-phosphoshikimate 1-carboxyvinyltransferase [Gemmatimonadota bacterium]